MSPNQQPESEAIAAVMANEPSGNDAGGAAAPDADTLKHILEAALMAAGQPLGLVQLGELFADAERPTRNALAKALHELGEACADRGVELVEVASGFRFQIKPQLKNWVSRLWAERQTRYSRALLETLALIAYRQPITRGEIEQIRGVAVSSNIIRTLEEREWVRVIGHRDVPGKPALFGTTKNFLDYFNLKSLDQLPALSELRDIPELEPQLALDGEPPALGTEAMPIALEADAEMPSQPIDAAANEASANDDKHGANPDDSALEQTP